MLELENRSHENVGDRTLKKEVKEVFTRKLKGKIDNSRAELSKAKLLKKLNSTKDY